MTVVMTRDTRRGPRRRPDYPELGCEGDPFRDVNGDGETGFGPGIPEHTRTRDELSAHIDLVNLARADVLLSIHINSFTENGVVIEVAGTETYWTDETPWGVPHSERLATAVQGEVVAALDGLATYERQDRRDRGGELLRHRPGHHDRRPERAPSRAASCRASWPRSGRCRWKRKPICWPPPRPRTRLPAR